MKIEALSVRSIITNRDGVHNFIGWPSVARLRNGYLAATASGFRINHLCPFGKVVMSVSPDEGKTWSIPAIVIDTPLDDRDSGIVPFGESSVMVTSFNNGLRAYDAMNGCTQEKEAGAYFEAYYAMMEKKQDPERYSGSYYRISHNNGLTFGEIRYVPVTNPHGPALLPDGTFFWVGNLIRNDSRGGLACYKIRQDGSCEYLCDIPAVEGLVSDEPHAIVLGDGTILVHIRMENLPGQPRIFTTYQSESYDGGRTFTKPHSIGISDEGGSPPHLICADGTLISVYGHRQRPFSIRAAFSRDRGKTWDVENVITEVETEYGDIGYPCSVALKDGSILTVYYASDDYPENRTFYGFADPERPVRRYTAPVIRQVIWRYEAE